MLSGDALCASCAKVDLFSLFTGPRYYPGDGHGFRVRAELGTLQEVKSNTQCPLCRLVKHDLYGQHGLHPWRPDGEECNPANVRCTLHPIRTDYNEDTRYRNAKTKDMVATRLQVRLKGLPGCSQEESDFVRSHAIGPGIQLLSPESVDPARPLLNGFRATSMESSLALLAKFIESCGAHHRETCQLDLASTSPLESRPDDIRVIDVQERRLVERGSTAVEYAALSYVWGQDMAAYAKLADELAIHEDESGDVSVLLPQTAPKVIEDAISVCKALSIPYLWVDLYCIHQNDDARKAVEIKNMGYIYGHAHITLVAGSKNGLLHASDAENLERFQKTETIGNQRYVTALPSIREQIQSSDWCSRGWCFQEGQLARRIAFFGGYDVSFLCGAGHWREGLHSGQHGHDANIAGVDLLSEGYYMLSAISWLGTTEWDFEEYESIVLAYSQRQLSYESDRLDAVSGCLNILAQKKNMQFFSGLPSIDFHYALLWEGEYDRPRAGFPSWSWAGWHAMGQMHLFGPKGGSTSGSLMHLENDYFGYWDENPPQVELQGVLISSGMERPHLKNKCSQRLAHLTLSGDLLTVKSEVARFSIEVTAELAANSSPGQGWAEGCIPPGFETASGHYSEDWHAETEYHKPYQRFHLRDSGGNLLRHVTRWYDHSPLCGQFLPSTLRGSTLTWLLRDGLELIKIAEAKLNEGAPELKPFHHVFCLGIDRTGCGSGCGRRMGMFIIAKELWDRAGPEEMMVEFS